MKNFERQSHRESNEQLANQMLERLRDPAYLPSHKELSPIIERLPSRERQYGGKWYELAWNDTAPVFEIWTEEYVGAFGDYLAGRVRELGGTKENPITILEVGAGDGRLSHFLSAKLREIADDTVRLVATDSGEWNIPPAFRVEKMEHMEALEKHKPHIVLFSWMPYRKDYTDAFRKTASVDEYILIGEYAGCCGDGWLTWGNVHDKFTEEERAGTPTQESYEESLERLEKEIPYIVDGFEMDFLDELSALQISRLAIRDNSGSSTVSFRRKSA